MEIAILFFIIHAHSLFNDKTRLKLDIKTMD